jgi:hypothetical protein
MANHFKSYLQELKIHLPYHDELNPKLFDKDKLKPNIRKILLDCAEKFRLGCKIIPKFKVLDILMTGGNANYNYSDISDIDVHILVDYNDIRSDKDLL